MTGVSGNNRNTPPHWDIALLGLWWSCNYGAVLTSFSLHCDYPGRATGFFCWTMPP